MAYTDAWGRITNVAPQAQYYAPRTPSSGGMMYANSTVAPTAPASSTPGSTAAYVPPAAAAAPAANALNTNVNPAAGTYAATAATGPTPFDWRQGAWQVANRWNPTWAMQNAWSTISDPKTVIQALNSTRPGNAAALAQWQNDLKYVNAAQANTKNPDWVGVVQPWGEAPAQPATGTPNVNYTPSTGVPTFDWSKWGGQTATNPLAGFAGIPSWMNDPNWAKNNPKEATAWASVMVPWSQNLQNAYQYANDANEAQRRYNLERAWTTAQDQFTMDQAVKTADYQKVRDQEEFALGRQQVWGRNVTPNTRWMRSWS